MTSVERIGLAGGRPRKFGPDFGGYRRYQPLEMAVGSKAVFISSRNGKVPGFTMLTRKSVKVLKEQQGAASNVISRIAWCKDRLYIAYEDAFGSYDPVNDRFQLLASSNSVRPKNPLDAR